jgi:hypothetical protein
MNSDRKGPLVILHGDPEDRIVREAIELLDRSGLAFRHEPGAAGRSAALPQIICVASSLSPRSRNEVIDFLREHGARFEDS